MIKYRAEDDLIKNRLLESSFNEHSCRRVYRWLNPNGMCEGIFITPGDDLPFGKIVVEVVDSANPIDCFLKMLFKSKSKYALADSYELRNHPYRFEEVK